ncbi:uncharacterized protein BP5553_07114 [Venustampulla echinocandica]|uniref:Uncharacterized protein n=1 Tax=Venustampulla echinocandica TaxID=2656787 RepID=A0A370TIK9_9HELO|nr:uncharacterized protein BP5553_07114 [Venustampulla echinocandica]RDL35183.1 hypothetical protein BP5553_07114 [Venustampulla echinocandica]
MAVVDLSFITSLKDRVKETYDEADEAGRRQLLDALRDLQYSVEPPEETMQRTIHQNLTIASVRAAYDLDVYKALTTTKETMSIQELTGRNGANPDLLGRLMRHQASLGMIEETGRDQFAANNITRNLSIPEIQSGIRLMNDAFGPVYQNLPAYLKKTKYRNPMDNPRTVFQFTRNTDLSLWDYLHARAADTSHFDNFMRAQRMSTDNCFSVLNLEAQSKGWPADRPVFVDVGGGMGQQCAAVRERFPHLAGRIILEDLPAVVSQAKVPAGVEVLPHDFWHPQPIKGARFYYLRAVLHDYNDVDSVKILKHIADAMEPHSVLLIDEMVLPNKGVDWYATQTDLLMMCAFGSAERTQDAWARLVEQAGLKVRSLRTYTHAMRLSVIEVVKRESLDSRI